MAKKNGGLSQEYNFDIHPEMFNKIYYPYLQTINRYEVYFGGSGSGKSNFVAHKLVLQLTSIAGRNLVCLRKQGVDVKDSCYPEIYAALVEFKMLELWDVVENPVPRLTNRINGNVIAFSGVDKIDNIKSIRFKNGRLTDIWYEEATEEPEEKNLRELDRRLRDPKHKCRIILSFNPVYATHWIKNFIEKELLGTDLMVLKTTYKDNRFIDKEYCQMLERYRFTDPYSYMVYALGQWGTMGRTVFDANKVNNRMMALSEIHGFEPPKHAEFSYDRDKANNPVPESFDIFYHADGETIIYREPESGHPYVCAFDTAGEGSDYYAAHVFDNSTGEQVATFHSLRMPPECVLQLFGLCRYYNDALVCPEVNFDAYPLQKFLEMHYHNIYVREVAIERLDAKTEPKLGFRTTPENRQRMLSELVDWVSENISLINDIETLSEMLSFTRQSKKLKGVYWAAEPGSNDDLIMSLAIMLQARSQQRAYIEVERKGLEGFWHAEELDFAVDSGTISRQEAQEYKQKSKMELGMSDPRPVKKRSRYAR